MLCLLFLFQGCGAQSPPPLVPLPQAVDNLEGRFSLSPVTRIRADAEGHGAADYLATRLKVAAGIDTRVEDLPKPGRTAGAIVIHLGDDSVRQRGAEAYDLEVRPDSAVIKAGGSAGAFYGVQTLLQLGLPEVYATNTLRGTHEWGFQCARIVDEPRFEWRGLLLDVARHFFNPPEVKEVIETLGMHKLNRLQLHLTDDQGWRVPIAQYPKLVEVGAWRKEIGFGLDPKSSTAYGPDGRYGGCYTREQIRELVAFASSRHVTIVPEIEMPGHAGAALSAYPEYSCFGGPFSTDVNAGVFDAVFCPGKEATFTFLEAVLSEVMELFPGKYIHIGGDEVPKRNWKKCPDCQSRMKAEGLKTEEQLQTYFINRIGRFIQSKGRVMVGWSEILEGGLPDNAVLMDWIGGAVQAATNSHSVVMSPVQYAYLDYYQSTNRAAEPRAIGGFLPLEKVYSFEPVPERLPAAFNSKILGAQGNLWTEYIASLQHAQYMMFPRLCAMAEVTWSGPERDFTEFLRRLQVHLRRLDAMGVNYRRPDLEQKKQLEQ